tara:strand:+ start:1734 stop:1997 length:264 start_codon:yes stop_codon:yes gene_type:complete
MIKELKYLLFMLIVSLFIFLTLKYYFSNENKKNSYRLSKKVNEKIIIFSEDLVLLHANTNGVVEYVEKTIDKNKKNYNFWKLIVNDK